MPEKKPLARTGSYAASTAPQLRGQAGNKTRQYLDAIDPENPGRQAFYQAALTGIPHPLNAGQTLSYGELQALLSGPQGAAAVDAYGRRTNAPRTPTKAEYQQAMFEQANAALLARGAANPGQLAFPAAADEALRAPNRAVAVARGNFVQPAFGALTNPLAQAQRFAHLPPAAAYAAPGVPMRTGLSNPLRGHGR